jgi:hypothetical protein
MHTTTLPPQPPTADGVPNCHTPYMSALNQGPLPGPAATR